MDYFPLDYPIYLLLFVLLGFLVVLLELHVLSYVYERVGIAPRYVLLLLLVSLLGSYVNLPIMRLSSEPVVTGQVVDFFGMRYVIPVVQNWPGTLIAVNVGGAVVPALLSLYLLIRNRLWLRGAVGIVLVTIAVHLMAQPVRGVGIAVPTFLPPLIAALVAVLLARRRAPALAYIAGSMGTLIGADLLNLDKIQGLGAPVASIGGAGTFDGVFLTGVIAVILASLPLRRARSDDRTR